MPKDMKPIGNSWSWKEVGPILGYVGEAEAGFPWIHGACLDQTSQSPLLRAGEPSKCAAETGGLHHL